MKNRLPDNATQANILLRQRDFSLFTFHFSPFTFHKSKLSPRIHNLLYLRKLIESLKRGEVIDVNTEDFIPHLTEHRVIELKEAQLCLGVGTRRHILHIWLSSRAYLITLFLQCLEDDVGTLDDGMRHTGKLRHMNTE